MAPGDSGNDARGRRGRPRSEAAHQAVLAAAARLMESVPFEQITVEAIATEAGVGKQTIYRWWPNKAAVILEAVLSGHLRTEFVDLPETGDLEADLTAWMEGTLEAAFSEEILSIAQVMLAALIQARERSEALVGDYHVWDEGTLVDRLRAEQAAGRLRQDVDPRAASAVLLDPLLLRMITTGRPDREWARSLVRIVLAGLRPTPSAG